MSTAAVRRFNRFYTGQIGVLRKSYLNSDLSLAEARVDLRAGDAADPDRVSEIARDLGLDAGYLSRVLDSFAGARADYPQSRAPPTSGRCT
jgi:DNA-binding MarR family transcriptional regulator